MYTFIITKLLYIVILLEFTAFSVYKTVLSYEIFSPELIEYSL